MSPRVLDRMLMLGGLALLVVSPVVGLRSGHLLEASHGLPQTIVFLATGAMALAAQPGHRGARRLLGLGVVMAAGFALGGAYSAFLLTHPTPGWGWAAILSLQVLELGQALALLGLLAVFPDGRYHAATERGVVRAGAAYVLLVVAGERLGSARLTYPGAFIWGDSVTAPNPGARFGMAPVGQVAWIAYQAGFLLLAGTGLLLLVLRYRHFGPDERRQTAWPLYGIVVTIVTVAVLGALGTWVHQLPPALVYVLYAPAALAIPVSIAIGMVRHRLLDIDRVIRRSAVYGVLWLLIAASYIAVTLAIGIAAGGRVPLALAVALTIGATLVVAPIRRRLEGLADRLVFGHRASGYEVLGRVGTRLDEVTDPQALAQVVAGDVHHGLRATWVRVTLVGPSGGPATATAGDPTGEPVLSLPLARGHDQIGTVDCGPRGDGRGDGRYDAADREVLQTICRQAALSAHNGWLAAELAGQLDELAASRERIVVAEEEGRRRLERDLHDGVQQDLVALLAQLGLARNQLRRDPVLAAQTLDTARGNAKTALVTLQDLSRGIHPTLLTDRGIVAAVSERASRMTLPVEVQALGLDERRFPPAVEGAAYFVVCEALGNTLKHAGARRASVCLEADGTQLCIAVRDDGCGFDVDAVLHRGLVGLRDRVETMGGATHREQRAAGGDGADGVDPGDPLVSASLTVVIAEDNYLVREGTRRLLEDSGEVAVLASVGDATALLAAVAEHQPDAVITDIRMPPSHGTEGIQAARDIRRTHPAVGVVVLSQYSDAAYATDLFRDGTEGLGYLLKSSIGELDEILAALRAVVAGRSVVDPLVVERLVDQRVHQAESRLRGLTPRELDVLREMAEGRTNAGIAERLYLSESAIEKYVKAIFTKLGLGSEQHVSRRVAAVLAYLRDPPEPLDEEVHG